MSITHNSNIIADVRFEGVYGRPAVGGYLLQFGLSLQTQAWEDDKRFHFDATQARISVGTGIAQAVFLGIAFPYQTFFIDTHKFSGSHSLQLDLLIQRQTFLAIEEIRKGEDLSFTIELQGKTSLNGAVAIGRDEIRALVNQKSWLTVLKEIGFSEFFLFEVPVPNSKAPDALHDAVRLLKKAQEFFFRGEYEEAIGTCRRSLEGLAKGLKEAKLEGESVVTFCKGDRKSMTQRQRFMFLRQAVQHFTHPVHHAPSDDPSETMTRIDAMMILSMTAAILSKALNAKEVHG